MTEIDMENSWNDVRHLREHGPARKLEYTRGYGCGIGIPYSARMNGYGHGSMSGQGDGLKMDGFGNGCARGTGGRKRGTGGYGI